MSFYALGAFLNVLLLSLRKLMTFASSKTNGILFYSILLYFHCQNTQQISQAEVFNCLKHPLDSSFILTLHTTKNCFIFLKRVPFTYLSKLVWLEK